jgi:hypothetical protein
MPSVLDQAHYIYVNIQLNEHFYIFFQITIYSYGSLADEI